MGNKRSRAARLSGGGPRASSRWLRQLEIARQEHAARQMLAATGGRPVAASTRKLRALGALMFLTCILLGAAGAVLGVRFFR